MKTLGSSQEINLCLLIRMQEIMFYLENQIRISIVKYAVLIFCQFLQSKILMEKKKKKKKIDENIVLLYVYREQIFDKKIFKSLSAFVKSPFSLLQEFQKSIQILKKKGKLR